MSHEEQSNFVKEVKSIFPDMFIKKNVLEIGSLNINGTARQYFENCNYIGIDVVSGPCVDKVCWAHEHTGKYDVVISCESLEHDPFRDETLNSMSKNLKENGLIIITAAGPKRSEHGTLRTNPTSSGTSKTEYGDYYKNVTEDDLIVGLGLNVGWKFEIRYGREMMDIYLWAVKNGA